MNKQREMIRVNTRISMTANKWLDDYSAETGLPKSTIIMMAIEDYIKQKDVIERMGNMQELYLKLEQIEKKIDN